ncbi:MAG: hypothetical protein JO298_10900 [Verrucomicrobia bacterium]|nr:hypothetical protein [Verrucomicrobiota bacterium]MBV9644740.1 hypothetical protein [Verrucomicrobiota bacterium]
MKTALKKFFGRIGDAVRQAPSYESDTQRTHREKEQMSQPQEEFLDAKSISTKSTRTAEAKKRG